MFVSLFSKLVTSAEAVVTITKLAKEAKEVGDTATANFFVANHLTNVELTLEQKTKLTGEVTLLHVPASQKVVFTADQKETYGYYVKFTTTGTEHEIVIVNNADPQLNLIQNKNYVIYNANAKDIKIAKKADDEITCVDASGTGTINFVENVATVPTGSCVILTPTGKDSTVEIEVAQAQRKALTEEENIIVTYPAEEPKQVHYCLDGKLVTDDISLYRIKPTFVASKGNQKISIAKNGANGYFFVANKLNGATLTVNKKATKLEGKLISVAVPANQDMEIQATETADGKVFGHFVKLEPAGKAAKIIIAYKAVTSVQIQANENIIVYNPYTTTTDITVKAGANAPITVTDKDGADKTTSLQEGLAIAAALDGNYAILTATTASKFDILAKQAEGAEETITVEYPAKKPELINYALENGDVVKETLNLYPIDAVFTKPESEDIAITNSDPKRLFIANNLVDATLEIDSKQNTLTGKLTYVAVPEGKSVTIHATQAAGKVYGHFIQLTPEGKVGKVVVAYKSTKTGIKVEANENLIVYNPYADKAVSVKATLTASEKVYDNTGAEQTNSIAAGVSVPYSQYIVLTPTAVATFNIAATTDAQDKEETVIIDYPLEMPQKIEYILDGTKKEETIDFYPLNVELTEVKAVPISIPDTKGNKFFIANNLENYTLSYGEADQTKTIDLTGTLTAIKVGKTQKVTLNAPETPKDTQNNDQASKKTASTQADTTTPTQPGSTTPTQPETPTVDTVYGYFVNLKPEGKVGKIIIINSAKEANDIKENENIVIYNANKEQIIIKKIKTADFDICNENGASQKYVEAGFPLASKGIIVLSGKVAGKFSISLPTATVSQGGNVPSSGSAENKPTTEVESIPNIEVEYNVKEPETFKYILNGEIIDNSAKPTPEPGKDEEESGTESESESSQAESTEIVDAGSNQEEDGGTNVGAIVGGVVGGVAGIAIIAGLVFFFVSRKKAKVAGDAPNP